VKKSDSRTRRRISATRAGRSLSRILDEVERGCSYTVHRHGKDVCSMAPVAPVERRASECLAILRAGSDVRLDDRFAADLLHVLRGEKAERRPWG
jgi:antitoxin (DNA-binding transcriptional repressor) of toxin-antitoxin stability system